MADQVKYTNKLHGKKVLITGGTSGIGFAVAEALLEHGATVIISSSKSDRVENAIARLQTAYPSARNITGHACDLGVEATLESNVKDLFDKVGMLDHIVHTAGDALPNLSLETATLDQIKQVGMVRFFAPLVIAQYGQSHLNPERQASFTFTTGSAAEKPLPGREVISSFIGGLPTMAKALALKFKPARVNVVSPGVVHTELWDGMPGAEAVMEHFEKTLPVGKVAAPEEVAEAYLYLMRDPNITGSMISTNGGRLLV